MITKLKLLIFLRTMIVGLIGGVVFQYLGMPAAFLSGAMFAVAIFSLKPMPTYMPLPLRDAGMLLAGILTGCAIRPEMILGFQRYPMSLFILALTLIAVTQVSSLILQRYFGFDRDTAVLSSMPGALSVVIAVTLSVGADIKRVAAVQSMRMLVLIIILPGYIAMSGAPINMAQNATILRPQDLALIAVLSIIIVLLFLRLKIMAPYLFAGMLASGSLQITGVVTGTLPQFFAQLALLMIGIYAGTRFGNTDKASLKSFGLAAFASFMVTLIIAFIGAELAVYVAKASNAEALVAFAPGGLEAMMVVGLALGLDSLYLSVHHVSRFLAISFALPFIFRKKT